MFIELAEHLRCPVNHGDRSYLVLVPAEMADRSVINGFVACPICRTEYPVQRGLTVFGAPPFQPVAPHIGAEVLQALLLLDGPGGYVVMVGGAGSLASALASALSDVRLVVVNGPAATPPLAEVSQLTCSDSIPLNDSMARGVVVGGDYANKQWLSQAARVLLGGLRLVVLDEVDLPESIDVVARAPGITVGVKQAARWRAFSPRTVR